MFIKKLALGWQGPTYSGFGYQIRLSRFLSVNEWPTLDDLSKLPIDDIRIAHEGILLDGLSAGKIYLKTRNAYKKPRRVILWQLSKSKVIIELLKQIIAKINDVKIKVRLQLIIDDLQKEKPKNLTISTKSDSPLALWRIANKYTCRRMGELLGVTAAAYSLLELGKWRPRPHNVKWVDKVNALTGDPETFNKMLAWYTGEKPKIEITIPNIYQKMLQLGFALPDLINVLSISIPRERVTKFIKRQTYPNKQEREVMAAMLGAFTPEEVEQMDFEK